MQCLVYWMLTADTSEAEGIAKTHLYLPLFLDLRKADSSNGVELIPVSMETWSQQCWC